MFYYSLNINYCMFVSTDILACLLILTFFHLSNLTKEKLYYGSLPLPSPEDEPLSQGSPAPGVSLRSKVVCEAVVIAGPAPSGNVRLMPVQAIVNFTNTLRAPFFANFLSAKIANTNLR